jgi:hypothetical protein
LTVASVEHHTAQRPTDRITVRTGKLERWHKTLKSEGIRPGTPLSLEDAKRLIQQYVDRYNHVRLHSAIGYVTPNDMLTGRQAETHAERDRKLEEARQQRQLRRRQAAYAGTDRLNPIGQCKLRNVMCRFQGCPTSVTGITDTE